MFTGIIEETGKVRTITSDKITVSCNHVLQGIKTGDSISVNGVCLTARSFTNSSFTADISPETCRVTAFDKLKAGSVVNLERAMKADGRFGGHIVSGHIDGKGKCKAVRKNDNFYNIEIEIPAECSKYVIQKGSVTVNGISLTVAKLNNNTIGLAIIPHTFENTNLKYLQPEDIVNIEVDMIAKYVEKFLSMSDNRARISMDFLEENGYL